MGRIKGSVDAVIGQVLRNLRSNAGMTQEDLGGTIGVSYQQIQKYEAGANRVALSTSFRLADALGISPKDFVAEVELAIAEAATIRSEIENDHSFAIRGVTPVA